MKDTTELTQSSKQAANQASNSQLHTFELLAHTIKIGGGSKNKEIIRAYNDAVKDLEAMVSKYNRERSGILNKGANIFYAVMDPEKTKEDWIIPAMKFTINQITSRHFYEKISWHFKRFYRTKKWEGTGPIRKSDILIAEFFHRLLLLCCERPENRTEKPFLLFYIIPPSKTSV